jgi:tetrahedral aminopeptidase
MNQKKLSEIESYSIGEEQIKLLERLSNACSVSGDEGEVRNIVLGEVRPLTDNIQVDTLGNVIVTRTGKGKNRLKVMVAAHMDEIGFMVTVDDGGGLFQFQKVGGVDSRQLPGKPVLIGHDHIPAVIGARAIHLTTQEQRRSVIPLETLRLDIGPNEHKGKIKIGDRATFATRFSSVRGSVRGKALDNRLGVATLIELLKKPSENVDLQAVFTTQEEIGGRGASTAAYRLNPDLAIALDSSPAYDMPTWDDSENTMYNTRLGFGPAVYIMDPHTISDPRLVKYVFSTAEKYGIPCQIRQPGGGGTDAGAIQRQREGIPSLSISVPGRHAHTPIGLAYISDWQNTLKLFHAVFEDITASILERN